MQKAPYRFEKHIASDFPVYASSPNQKRHIVMAHYHREAEIMKIIKGSVEVHVDTKVYTLNEGELIFCAPYTVHEVISEDENAILRGFTFDAELLKEAVDFTTARDSHILFSGSHPKVCEISQIFDELHRVYKAMPQTFRLRITAGLLILTSVLTESNFLLHSGENEKKLLTTPVIKYIRENYMQPLSVSELASLVNLCNDSFIRIFKKEQGQTPCSYIVNLRITEALKLLSENKYSVSEIASLIGFTSASFFSKTFKEKLGVSPIKYRKEHFFKV